MLSESDPTPVIATSGTISEVRGSRRASVETWDIGVGRYASAAVARSSQARVSLSRSGASVAAARA
jgi:hypothetical protein